MEGRSVYQNRIDRTVDGVFPLGRRGWDAWMGRIWQEATVRQDAPTKMGLSKEFDTWQSPCEANYVNNRQPVQPGTPRFARLRYHVFRI